MEPSTVASAASAFRRALPGGLTKEELNMYLFVAECVFLRALGNPWGNIPQVGRTARDVTYAGWHASSGQTETSIFDALADAVLRGVPRSELELQVDTILAEVPCAREEWVFFGESMEKHPAVDAFCAWLDIADAQDEEHK